MRGLRLPKMRFSKLMSEETLLLVGTRPSCRMITLACKQTHHYKDEVLKVDVGGDLVAGGDQAQLPDDHARLLLVTCFKN